MELFEKYEKMIFGTSILEVLVTASYEYCDSDVDDMDFDSDNDRLAYIERFNTGELMNVVLIVKATVADIEGVAILGACHVTGTGDMETTINDYDLVIEALDDLENNLNKHLNLLKKLKIA